MNAKNLKKSRQHEIRQRWIRPPTHAKRRVQVSRQDIDAVHQIIGLVNLKAREVLAQKGETHENRDGQQDKERGFVLKSFRRLGRTFLRLNPGMTPEF